MPIKDPIYGHVDIPELCRAFMDGPEMHRLRNIRQLGFVDYVYPSANHTRFAHSLGVMHMAGEVVNKLRATGVVVSDREKELVQLAGLMHDAGHIAFSHVLDDLVVEALGWPTHEARSVELVGQANDRLGLLTADEVATVGRMIHGDTAGADRPFLFQIVSNHQSGIDVDRMDYLARDSHHTGMPGFQPGYLIRRMRVVGGHLAIQRNAAVDVRRMLVTRQEMFLTVYRHRAVASLERVVERIIHDLLPFEADWRVIDDSWLLVRIQAHPLYRQIESRSWDKTPVDNPFEHCTLVTDQAVARELAKVVYC
jgi:hypothetical protein